MNMRGIESTVRLIYTFRYGEWWNVCARTPCPLVNQFLILHVFREIRRHIILNPQWGHTVAVWLPSWVPPNDHTHPHKPGTYLITQRGGFNFIPTAFFPASYQNITTVSVDIAYKFTSAHLNQFISKFYNSGAHHQLQTLFWNGGSFYISFRQMTSCFRRFWALFYAIK